MVTDNSCFSTHTDTHTETNKQNSCIRIRQQNTLNTFEFDEFGTDYHFTSSGCSIFLEEFLAPVSMYQVAAKLSRRIAGTEFSLSAFFSPFCRS